MLFTLLLRTHVRIDDTIFTNNNIVRQDCTTVVGYFCGKGFASQWVTALPLSIPTTQLPPNCSQVQPAPAPSTTVSSYSALVAQLAMLPK
jgi:hypothetical protein